MAFCTGLVSLSIGLGGMVGAVMDCLEGLHHCVQVLWARNCYVVPADNHGLDRQQAPGNCCMTKPRHANSARPHHISAQFRVPGHAAQANAHRRLVCYVWVLLVGLVCCGMTGWEGVCCCDQWQFCGNVSKPCMIHWPGQTTCRWWVAAPVGAFVWCVGVRVGAAPRISPQSAGV
jgi:hypothetical protein